MCSCSCTCGCLCVYVPMCLYVYVSTYQSINQSNYPSIHLSICPSVHLSICPSVHLSICPSVHLSTYPPIHLSTYPPIHLSIYPSNHLTIYLPIYLCIYVSMYLCIYLSIYLSVYPSIRLSIYLSISKLENKAFLRDILNALTWQHQKRSNSARLFNFDHVQNEGILRDLNFQKCSDVRTWCVLHILTSKCDSRHNGVQFFISHLPRRLRTRRFSEPTFRPSGATNHLKKHNVSRLCYLFAHLHLLSSDSFSSLIFSLLLFSSLLFSTLPTSAFPSLHIVGSLTSKLPSAISWPILFVMVIHDDWGSMDDPKLGSWW